MKKMLYALIKFLKILLLFILILLFSNFIKLFVIDVYFIPSSSMEIAIYPGDHVIVNKLLYGPRWPRDPLEINWLNLLALNDTFYLWFKNTNWVYRRWPKGQTISRNDVIVFDSPEENKMTLVKRCKGIPEDIVEVREGVFFLNNKIDMEPSTVSYVYKVDIEKANLINFDDNFTSKYPSKYSSNTNHHNPDYLLPPSVALSMKNVFGDSSIQLDNIDPVSSKSAYGPLYIPGKGIEVNLNKFKREINHYLNIINKYEGITAKVVDDIIYLDGKPDSLFVFQHNYYFMLGDNRYDSEDSRKWGLIPEENVIGKAIIVFSDNSFSKVK